MENITSASHPVVLAYSASREEALLKKSESSYTVVIFSGSNIFGWPIGNPASPESPQGVACNRVGIENFRFHDLRHTAASWLRMQGADIHTVAQLLGHKDLRMAARYQHLSPAFLADAVGRLDEIFGDACHQSVTSLEALTPRLALSA